MINGCPWSAEVLDRLLDLGWPMLLGNHDDAVLQLGTPRMEPATTTGCATGRSGGRASSWRPAPGRVGGAAPGGVAVASRCAGAAPGPRAAGQLLRRLPPRLTRRLGRAPPGSGGGGHGGGRTHPCGDGAADPQAGRRRLVGDQQRLGRRELRRRPAASYVWLEGDRRGWQADIRRVDYDRTALEQGYRNPALRPRAACWARCSCAPRSPDCRGSPISCGGCGSSSATNRPTCAPRSNATMPATAPAAGRFR